MMWQGSGIPLLHPERVQNPFRVRIVSLLRFLTLKGLWEIKALAKTFRFSEPSPFRVFLVLFLTISVTAQSQDLAQTLAFADQQSEMGNHTAAMQAYKRVIFFQTNDFKENVFSRLANSYFQLNEYKEAAKYYDLAYAYERNDSLKTEFTLQKALCLLTQQQYSYSILELFSLDENLNPKQEGRKNFYMAISHFGQNEFDKSEEYFLKCTDDTLAQAQIKKQFDKNARIKLNPKTAKTLSIILPGLGQFYAGDIKNGLNSMVLTGGLIVLGIYSAVQFTIFDAALTILPWFQRYYTGGFKKAEIIAQEKLDKKREVIYTQIIDIIANSSKSE